MRSSASASSGGGGDEAQALLLVAPAPSPAGRDNPGLQVLARLAATVPLRALPLVWLVPVRAKARPMKPRQAVRQRITVEVLYFTDDPADTARRYAEDVENAVGVQCGNCGHHCAEDDYGVRLVKSKAQLLESGEEIEHNPQGL